MDIQCTVYIDDVCEMNLKKKGAVLCKHDWINDEHAIYRFGSHNKHIFWAMQARTARSFSRSCEQCSAFRYDRPTGIFYICVWFLSLNYWQWTVVVMHVIQRNEKREKNQTDCDSNMTINKTQTDSVIKIVYHVDVDVRCFVSFPVVIPVISLILWIFFDWIVCLFQLKWLDWRL